MSLAPATEIPCHPCVSTLEASSIDALHTGVFSLGLGVNTRSEPRLVLNLGSDF